MDMRYGMLVLIVLGFGVWSIVSIIGSDAQPKEKMLWIAAIIFLPLIGLCVWIDSGPRESDVQR
jgi:hypothetical protein